MFFLSGLKYLKETSQVAMIISALTAQKIDQKVLIMKFI